MRRLYYSPWDLIYDHESKELTCFNNNNIIITDLTEEYIPNVIQIIYVLYNIHGRVCGSYESLLKKYEAINN
jgi:hypothetical protein